MEVHVIGDTCIWFYFREEECSIDIDKITPGIIIYPVIVPKTLFIIL